MLKRFIKISGTGRFLDYTHSSVPSAHRSLDFEKVNLIYGENGYGKTTLSLILKSLKGDNSLVIKKRAFDKAFPQIIELLTDAQGNPKLTFASETWNNHYSNIEIFDIHFINDNIYTGLEIQNAHKKKLFEIIFGNKGVQLKNEIQEIKNRIQNGQKVIKQTKDKIEFAIDKAFTADTFCKKELDPDIDIKIKDKESEILTAGSYSEIQSQPALSSLSIIDLPFDVQELIKVLKLSIDTISTSYLDKVNEHKNHLNMDGRSEEWLKMGYEAIEHNKCPFCLRQLDYTVEIFEAYRQYFNEEYNSLLSDVARLSELISDFNLEAKVLEIENEISANLSKITFWKKHLAISASLFSVIEKKEKIIATFNKVSKILNDKKENILKLIEPLEVFDFEEEVRNFNNQINLFNAEIKVINEKIKGLKSSTKIDVEFLRIDLKRLQAIKKRADKEISALCTDFIKYSHALDKLNERKESKQEKLEEYSASIFSKYSNTINKHLQSFSSCLEIKNFDSGYVGSSKEPMVKFALCINGHEIKQDDNPSDPCFKYSFSEGDKSALALAFFLTKLEVEGDIQDKIVVFDDPVSSFDHNRKSTTIKKLCEIGQSCKQLFVLTHNVIFAGEFWKSINQLPLQSRCYRIEFSGNTSQLTQYSIDTETLSSVLKDSLAIKNYLNNGCYTDEQRRSVARCLRPALESYFHLKFFDVVSHNEWLGTFIEKIRNAGDAEPFYKLKDSLTDLEDVNNYSKKYHHRNNSGDEPVIDAELRAYCDKTLQLIQRI